MYACSHIEHKHLILSTDSDCATAFNISFHQRPRPPLFLTRLFLFILTFLFFLTGNLKLLFLNRRSALPCTAHSHSAALCTVMTKKMAGKHIRVFLSLATALPLFSCHPCANRGRAGIRSGRAADNDQMDHRRAAATASKSLVHPVHISRPQKCNETNTFI